ncbi:Flp pilus assembly protein CpaB [Serinicoccus sp. LYQ131]|uniref:Flp pilus assembly protein CpaB n=1 Tax=Serinicoccus sp. LYQ131 TaxID=3378797 RepID=UPI0038532098
MIRRVIAAVAALVLAGVGVLLVLSYAGSADRRAMEDQETVEVLVAEVAIDQGTTGEALTGAVTVRQVPRTFLPEGVLTDVDDLDGTVAVVDVAAGEQLLASRFLTPEELRSRDAFTLPEEAEGLHQLTVPLQNPRALGGNIAPGDRVGVFGSFSFAPIPGYVLTDDGQLIPDPDAPAPDATEEGTDEGTEEDPEEINFTDLLMHKALVVRVEGGYVAPPPALEGEEVSEEAAQDSLNVTIALEAQEAARVIYAMDHGLVWFTLEPESADDDPIDAIVGGLPDRARSVLE